MLEALKIFFTKLDKYKEVDYLHYKDTMRLILNQKKGMLIDLCDKNLFCLKAVNYTFTGGMLLNFSPNLKFEPDNLAILNYFKENFRPFLFHFNYSEEILDILPIKEVLEKLKKRRTG
ncbi:MAG: hypothetical protein Fur0024_1490 [Patescibacteria group bacterium]